MDNLTQDQVIELGTVAEELLEDPRIMWFFRSMQQLTLETIGSTLPAQSADREHLYYQYRAVDDVLGMMGQYAAARDKVKLLQEQLEAPEETEE